MGGRLIFMYEKIESINGRGDAAGDYPFVGSHQEV